LGRRFWQTTDILAEQVEQHSKHRHRKDHRRKAARGRKPWGIILLLAKPSDPEQHLLDSPYACCSAHGKFFPDFLVQLPAIPEVKTWCENDARAMRELVLDPSKHSGIQTVVIINALDKCKNSDLDDFHGSKLLYSLIPLKDGAKSHIKFLITAPRAEAHIQKGFKHLNDHRLVETY
jgi:hypothetical protein